MGAAWLFAAGLPSSERDCDGRSTRGSQRLGFEMLGSEVVACSATLQGVAGAQWAKSVFRGTG